MRGIDRIVVWDDREERGAANRLGEGRVSMAAWKSGNPHSGQDLHDVLIRLDRRSYRAYRDIEGTYRFPIFDLSIDHVQSDPFAPPSRLRVRIDRSVAGYPPEITADGPARRAFADFAGRSFQAALRRLDARALSIDAGEQTVLERTSCVVTDNWIEVRFTAKLPGAGRTILGREAARLLTETVPAAVTMSLPWESMNQEAAWQHVRTIADAIKLRRELGARGLVAFVADGAVLPRLSGASDLPLRDTVIRFESPPELRVALPTAHSGDVTGMGIPRGVTLIVGGGYHGKTTLLEALQAGIYDHVPGDGREQVVTVPDAVKIRAEDGRRIDRVDVSPFLSNLPFSADTKGFSTANASGSTSQAASIMETLEVGTSCLLLDEDTSATNFMLRDELMQRLVPRELEPITPFIDRVRELRDRGVSTIMVAGGEGHYFDVADRVILMAIYKPRDVTDRAHGLVAERGKRKRDNRAPFEPPVPRIPLASSLEPESGRGRAKVRATDRDEIRFGREEIELQTIDQIVDISQTRAIAAALLYLVQSGYVDGRRTLSDALSLLEDDIDEHGLDVISRFRFGAPPGDLARPRVHEVAAALNRLRTLQVRQVESTPG